MITTDKSPLEKLITSWLTDPPTDKSRIRFLHIQLWDTVSQDCRKKYHQGIITTPTGDPKVKWAVQFLEKLSGERKQTCTHLEAAARFCLGLPLDSAEEDPNNPSKPTGKSAAAHDY